jgi:hypothetical protein
MRDNIEDIAVVSGLAVFVVWTCVFLPLAFYHT